jgi:hypothetical protein
MFSDAMDPPLSAHINSMDNLVGFCQKWARNHGYAIAKSNSHPGKNIYVRCNQSGHYCGSVLNKTGRQTAFFKVDCPFQAEGSVPTSKKVTSKLWTLEIINAEHNHSPSPGVSPHPAHRQLMPEQYEEIQKLSKSNLPAAQILLQICTSNNETFATNRTNTNALQKIRREDLAGCTPIKALMVVLKETNWVWDVKVNGNGHIQNLFFAHPGSIHLAQINHHVALLDASYKTNWYRIPLLHVIGQAASNRSFSIGFCFLTYEDDENYLWAVTNPKKHIWRPEQTPNVFITNCNTALRNALAEVFPHSQANLCTWHLNKNITTHCKQYFSSGTPKDSWERFMVLWQQITYSKTPKIYADNLAKLKKILVNCPAVLNYPEKSIIPVKNLFVLAWACQHPHLQNLNTSQVESGHAYLKMFVTNSTGDLLLVFKSLAQAVDSQINQVHESVGKDTMKM